MDSTPALLHVDAEYGRKYSGIQPSWRSNGAVARPLTNNSRRNVDLRTDRRFYPYSSFAWLFSGRAWIRDGGNGGPCACGASGGVGGDHGFFRRQPGYGRDGKPASAVGSGAFTAYRSKPGHLGDGRWSGGRDAEERDGDVFHGECEGVCFACFHGGHSSKGRRADGG